LGKATLLVLAQIEENPTKDNFSCPERATNGLLQDLENIFKEELKRRAG
jgi:hypothetical protein